MSEAKEVRLNLKAVINKEKTRVLFAEVDNDFVDVLFSFLILPLAKIIYALDKHYGDKTPHVVGSFNSLYHGLANLLTFEFQLYGLKPCFLKIESAYLFPFLDQNYNSDYESSYLDEAYFVVLRVFTQENASFVICDDLRILPNGNQSMVQTLNILGVDLAEIDGAQTTSVTFGVDQIMNFLKGLLTSRQPLTDTILDTLPKSVHQNCILPSIKLEPATSLPHIENEATSNSIYNLKVVYQKSSNKLLFAQAEKDFVSYIATMLTVPLGIVDLHLGGDTCFTKLDHLYRSLGDLINPKYIEETKKVHLMKRETHSSKLIRKFISDLNAEGSRMYMVTDDLTVTHLCIPSTVTFLNEMKICGSDVEEVELQIGLEEACNILKASLTSTHALSMASTIPNSSSSASGSTNFEA